MNFYIAMQDLGKLSWTNANSQCSSYVFCGSLKSPVLTLYQLQDIDNNKLAINSLLSTNGGTQLTNDYYWSSTNYGDNNYYAVDMPSGSVHRLPDANRYNGYNVRPVLTSW